MSRAKTVVITGATSGIGRAITHAFSAAGAKLFLIGRSDRKMATVAKSVPRRQLLGFALADLTREADLDRLTDQLGKTLKRIDVLVHSAGDHRRTDLADASLRDFDALFQVNVRAPFALTQRLLQQLSRARGQIIFLNSSVVRGSGDGVAAYKATKHALQGMADSLRRDLNDRGIRVSSVYPGQTATPQMKRIYSQRGAKYAPAKLMSARDVAAAAVMLASLPRGMEVTDIHIRSVHRY
jgi:NADP-dependent 3-hydroxy acid dehydrogenase YdfG